MKDIGIVKVNVAKTSADKGIVLRIVIPKGAYQFLDLQKGDYLMCAVNPIRKSIEYRRVKC